MESSKRDQAMAIPRAAYSCTNFASLAPLPLNMLFIGTLSHKLLGNFSATFEIFGNFLEFWQLLEFSVTLGFLRFFEVL